MKYISSTTEQFVNFVKNRKARVILFGSGTVCKTFVPYVFTNNRLEKTIDFIVDNNTSKQGRFVRIGDCEVPVVSVDRLINQKYYNHCVLITNGDFYSVMKQLNQIDNLRDVSCFIAAYMQLEKSCNRTANFVYKDTANPIIPKTIHYCWFSGNPIPDNLKKCIETWKMACPDYDIVRWDESNFDLSRYKYTVEAYKLKKWGYIPDVARLEILYKNGGFYFDTDVEIVRYIEELRFQEAFCGRERAGHINFGGGSGCVKGNKIIKEILEFRENEIFDLGNGEYNSEASGYYETYPLMKKGLVIDDVCQKLDGINIYSSEFFSPYNYINGDDIRNNNTFSIHYFNGSWIEENMNLRAETREKYMNVREGLEEINND